MKTWMRDRINPGEITKYLSGDVDFIPDSEIEEKIRRMKNPDPAYVRDILAKACSIETLSPDETAALLNVEDPDILEEMKEAAYRVKHKVYDNRIVTFAPLYMGNLCVNNCLYCAFGADNKKTVRRVLTLDEIKAETRVLAGEIGHKRLIVVYGEHPSMDTDYITASIRAVYGVKVPTKRGHGQIRRVNVNAAPLSIAGLKELRDAGIGTYQVFQETYHRRTYGKVHPAGTIKADYRWRLYCMHRAFEAGVDDVGIGALFGLYDWKFEVMGLLYHARELEEKFGIGPHTVSFPRLEPAANTPFTQNENHKVSDSDFKKLVTVLRLAIPYTGMILTARESAGMRREVLPVGCTQTDASTRIGIGAYSDKHSAQEGRRQQFILGDTRGLDEIIRELAHAGYITSFCTAGYRCGRTGKHIMGMLRSGKEGEFCKLNAVLTFREWLDDFASPETFCIGEELIEKEISQIKKKLPGMYPELIKNYEKTKNGKRDLYF